MKGLHVYAVCLGPNCVRAPLSNVRIVVRFVTYLHA